MQFMLGTAYHLVPGAPPPGFPARKKPTTQIEVRVLGWPGNVFRVWLPESVSELWNNVTAEVARQEFKPTQDNGLVWAVERHQAVFIEAELTPLEHSLLLEVRVANRSRGDLSEVVAMNCLQLAAAPDFACHDFSRLYLRSEGRWQSLASLRPTCDDPYYYRPRFFRDGGIGWAGGRLAQSHQAAEADHPLIVCVSKDGRRAVGTASENYQFLFHNRANEHLRCIHSQAASVPRLAPGQAAIFRQKVYFVEGGLAECVAACEADARAQTPPGRPRP